MNDKLITYENLWRFYEDLNINDFDELDSKISNLIKDTTTANDSTWSSTKINSTINSKTSAIIKDTTTANNSTWSSSKINSEINSKTSAIIKDTTTANNSTWSSRKINSEIQAHSGATYTAGNNININSENVISAIINLATTADIEALFVMVTFYVDDSLYKSYGNLNWTQWLASRYNTAGFTHIYTAATYDSSVEQIPEVSGSATPTEGGHYYSTCEDTYVPTGQPDNEIWYTTRSGEVWEPYDEYNGGDTLRIGGNTLLSNTYQNGHGVLRYANNITELSDYWGNSDYNHNTDITSITLPHSITYIGNIMPNGNSELNTVHYNGTVAECGEIDMSYFAIYADFNINGQIVCTDGIYNMFE